jgi:hypothetical protein
MISRRRGRRLKRRRDRIASEAALAVENGLSGLLRSGDGSGGCFRGRNFGRFGG